jgi:hypothetical protein
MVGSTDFEGWAEVVGGRHWAQATGDRPGVVLVHAGIADPRMLEPLWPALKAAYRAARHNTRGFGRTVGEAVDDPVDPGGIPPDTAATGRPGAR